MAVNGSPGVPCAGDEYAARMKIPVSPCRICTGTSAPSLLFLSQTYDTSFIECRTLMHAGVIGRGPSGITLGAVSPGTHRGAWTEV